MSETKDTLYDFSPNDPTGEPVDLSQYKGKVVLVVNVASKCGLTPQYKGLQELYDTYKDQGFEIIGFPCNQFAHQEPGTSDEIGAFCKKNYGVSFKIMQKIDVNGKKAAPIYEWLKTSKPGLLGFKGIKWNFEKFLVDRNGKVVERFAPVTSPNSISSNIEKLLKEEKSSA